MSCRSARASGSEGPGTDSPRRIISGWQASGNLSGAERRAAGLRQRDLPGQPAQTFRLRMDQRTVDRWFNIDAGFERNSALQPSQNLRTPQFAVLRRPGGRSRTTWILSIIKNTRLREGIQLQLRFEGDQRAEPPAVQSTEHHAEQQRVRPGDGNMGLAADGIIRRENSFLEQENKMRVLFGLTAILTMAFLVVAADAPQRSLMLATTK